jgi:hypothetical protein
MTTKHTPGPWCTGEPFETFPGAGLRFHISQAEGAPYTPHYSDVAQCVAETISSEILAIQRANANLIAAAPSMLAALEIADKFCGSLTSDECPDSVHIPIRAALAKARGET